MRIIDPRFETLANHLCPYAFAYPVIQADLGVASFLLAAFVYLRTQVRS